MSPFLFASFLRLFARTNQKKDLNRIHKYMVGYFTSEQQSKEDSNYFNIHLAMTTLWKQKDGYWLYVEQAASSSLSKPYRQRVYHLYLSENNEIASKVYEIVKPDRFINAHQNKNLLKSLSKTDLIDRPGCTVYLTKKDFYFLGSTSGKECISTLRGSSYATSKVEVYKDKILSWDQGWDAYEKQVWGAMLGGYRFLKQ